MAIKIDNAAIHQAVNGFLNSVGEAAINAGKEALKRAADGAADGVLSVAEEKIDKVSGLVTEGKRRVTKARSKVRRSQT